MNWIKSPYCGSAACVEVAREPGAVHVRDAAGRELTVTPEAWQAFLALTVDGGAR